MHTGLLHKNFICYKFVSCGKQRLPHSSGNCRYSNKNSDSCLTGVVSAAYHTEQNL